MEWLQALDARMFLWGNHNLVNPFFDWLMPFVSGNRYFVPTFIFLGLLLIWKGGRRGRIFTVLACLIWVIGDVGIISSLKSFFGRPRPFITLAETRILVGMGGSGSMPSGHAANWFMFATVAWWYYRRSIWFMLPMAVLVSFSRIYLGVHYPFDVTAGALVGTAYAAFGLWLAEAVWQEWFGRLFPLWYAQMPSLLHPEKRNEPVPQGTVAEVDQHWLRLGYALIFVFAIARYAYLAIVPMEVTEDEAYQWVWSKHLALSYYSKPPLIAYVQWLGTHILGDRKHGIRLFSPFLTMVVTLVLMRFLSRQVNIRVAFWTVLALSAAPLSAVGAILMTVDPLLVTFWTVAMVTGWQALQTGSTKSWLWTGFFLGLGCLSKYTALAQVACFACFFALHKPSRPQLRRAGPWLALVLMLVMQTPVLLWNAQHGWSTLHHVAEDAGVGNAWTPTLKYFFEFMAVEAGLLNPVFFIAMIWACISLWRRTQDVLIRYLFCMGAPLFLGYLLYSFKIRILPNWIAASVVPLFCVMVIYWERRWREGVKPVGTWLRVGLILGFVAVVLTHETRLIGRLAGRELPAGDDPLMRSRGWKETAAAVETEHLRLLREGKPVFVIGSHYGITGELSLYMEEGRRTVSSDQPLVYYLSSDKPHNQFYFWPGYLSRKGQNAIYVERIKTTGPIATVSEQLLREFTEVKDLGTREIFWKGRLARRIRMIECRSLK